MLGFLLGLITGIIVSLLLFLTLFVMGYNTIGTLLQIFQPEVELPSIRQLQKARKIKKSGKQNDN